MVGELHQHHAHILCHRQQHLAQPFELRRMAGAIGIGGAAAETFNHRHARRALGEFSNAGAKFRPHFERRGMRFADVHQQARHETLRVELEPLQYRRRRERVCKQRLAAVYSAAGNARREPFERLGYAGQFRIGIIGRKRGKPCRAARVDGNGDEFQMGGTHNEFSYRDYDIAATAGL